MQPPTPRLPRSRTAAALLIAALTLAAAGAPIRALARDPLRLQSPDGRIQLTLVTDGARPEWGVSFQGRDRLSGCGLGLETREGGDLLAGASPTRERRREVREEVRVPFGRTVRAADPYRELRVTFGTPRQARVDVVFRCYNDAVALRYELPAAGAGSAVTILEERTSFHAEESPAAFVQYLENHRTSHEHTVQEIAYRDIRPGALVDTPLTLVWADNTAAAITEAGLRRYAGMALRHEGLRGGDPVLSSSLTPRDDGSGARVVGTLPLHTPWRVVLLADRPGALLESVTLFCLNDPPASRDVSWIHPGKITFSWWNGDVYDGRPGPPILSLEMARRYIDFCARAGIPTHSLTSTENTVTPWYVQSTPGVVPGPDTDVTRPREGFDLPGIRRYAESKGVRLWTWVHQAALRGRVEEAFAAFEKMGWSGMMVDFFDHDDQGSVEHAEAILDAALRHHILIHLHGVWKPTGLERTYPNLMNHEGALNLEYLKWSALCTPEHNLNMAFTRLVAGPMDYHLGGFRSVPRDRFQPRNVAPNVLGTRCHHLAMYVCFDNPNPMVADYPAAYEGQPGFEFIQGVPTWWDETRVLEGRPGRLLVTARRKGDIWYVGCMSAREPREVAVPLSFLGRGRHTVRLWKDAPDADRDPNRLALETRTVSRTDTFTVPVALDGGFVLEIRAPEGTERRR